MVKIANNAVRRNINVFNTPPTPLRAKWQAKAVDCPVAQRQDIAGFPPREPGLAGTLAFYIASNFPAEAR
jgi:hypothetical protein